MQTTLTKPPSHDLDERTDKLDHSAEAFQELAELAERSSQGIIREYWQFLQHNKKWWLVPILIGLLLMTGVIILGGSSLAPFLYPMF